MKNMLRVAAVTPKVHIGSVSGNVREIMDIYEEYKDAADGATLDLVGRSPRAGRQTSPLPGGRCAPPPPYQGQ